MRSRGFETGWFRRVSGLVALLVVCAFTPALASEKNSARYDGFVLVRGGSFQMGDLWGDSPWAMAETPVRKVHVDDFLLARHETTVAEFERFVNATGHRTVAELDAGFRGNKGYLKDGKLTYVSWREHGFKQDPDHPVLLIAWEDAIVYCNWLSREHRLPIAYDEKTGQMLTPEGRPTGDVRHVRGFRLPTEAEWEFAARERGRKVRFGNGQDVARSEEMNFDAAGTGQMIPKLRMRGDNLHPYNEKGINRGGTTPVGSLRPNALGLYHMSGNAWEWCTDTGGADYPAEKVNPCAQGGSSHIIRGGMYDTDAKACRVSARLDWYPNAWCNGSGFRVALTVDPPESVATAPETAGMVYVEAGSFLMGDLFGDGKKWLPETPVHEVELGSFWLGRHEVTVREFRQFVEATGYRTSAEKPFRSVARGPGSFPVKRRPSSPGLAFGDQLADGGHKVDWDFHYSVGCALDRRLVLGNSLFVALGFVMVENPLNPVLIPSWGKKLLAHCFFLRLRRSARFAFGPIS